MLSWGLDHWHRHKQAHMPWYTEVRKFLCCSIPPTSTTHFLPPFSERCSFSLFFFSRPCWLFAGRNSRIPLTTVISESFMTLQFPPSAHLGSFRRDERRRQAGPMPLKRGEIGFVEGLHAVTNNDEHDTTFPLLAHHPADRDHQSPQAEIETRTVDELASNYSTAVPKGLFGRLKPKTIQPIGGLQVSSLLLFAIQLISFGGTIALWVFAIRTVKATLASRRYENTMGSLTVFIHVVFIIFVIGQVVLLERRIFRLRDERYQHLHPGQALPRHRHSPSSNSITSAAPWNRPPLPTYAAVLAQSGVATGDVEDNLIAILPPPAYGNVRGSTLLDSTRRD